MFERYFEEGSRWIPRESLSTPTRRNLRWLEKELGYQFDSQARKATFGWRPSYLIYGTDPQGEEVVYERRETSSRAAGQTFIWEGGKRRRLGDLGILDLSVKEAERDWARTRRAKRRLEEIEDLGVNLEEMGDEEVRRLDEILNRIEEKPKIEDSPWEYYKHPERFLSKEDRKELRRFLGEYRRELEE